MANRKIIYFGLVLIFIVAVILAGIICYNRQAGVLKVSFFSIGQGDSVLISQGANQVLIDGGKNGSLLLSKLGESIPFWDRSIEAVIATHPDYDHIGGLIDVVRSYSVGAVLETGAQSDSEAFKIWRKSVSEKGVEKVEAVSGVRLIFPSGARVEIVYPFTRITEESTKETNDHSVVAKLNYNDNSFLFTGDLPSGREVALVDGKLYLDSQVLKVAHHGSKYSTSDLFLDAVKPHEAIISVGDNNYGHPDEGVINRLRSHGAVVWRTDEEGDIVYKCDQSSDEEKCSVSFR